MVHFSSCISCSESLPSSLYLINDKRTALDSADHRSGGFGAPFLLFAPQRAIVRQSNDNHPFFFLYRASGGSPVLPLSYKWQKNSSGFRGSPIWRLRDGRRCPPTLLTRSTVYGSTVTEATTPESRNRQLSTNHISSLLDVWLRSYFSLCDGFSTL